jgi:exosortase family protein XrtF
MSKFLRGIWQQFRPTIIFLLGFLGSYLVLNLVYGMYVTKYYPAVDPATEWVTAQTSSLLDKFGWANAYRNHPTKPTTYITYQGNGIISIYEGCNGLNVVIVFFAFLAGFGPYSKKLFWFVPLGLGLIHLGNLTRLLLLFWVSLELPSYLYFTHKYLFTAFLYGWVMLLWGGWLLISKKDRYAAAS